MARPTDPTTGEQAIAFVLLVFGTALMIGPFLWMILSAFKPTSEIIAFPPTFLPIEPTLANFLGIRNRFAFVRLFANSLYVALVKTTIIVYVAALVGTVFGKYRFRGRDAIFAGIIATMMIPWPVTIIPLYQLMLSLRLIGTYTAIILPFALNTFGIFFMRQSIAQIPDDLMDAARIDGAGEFRIFHMVILPLSTNAISAITIFVFLWTWEDFLWPYLMVNAPQRYLLPVGLASFAGQYEIDYGGLFAAASLSVIPVLVVYFLFQKRFISGIALTGIK